MLGVSTVSKKATTDGGDDEGPTVDQNAYASPILIHKRRCNTVKIADAVKDVWRKDLDNQTKDVTHQGDIKSPFFSQGSQIISSR